ncbi:MAG TPA: phytoene/squalene synthase family protein, partial [Blastocatellia bacterium]|nr:phytoene/squalene synthase family protein [Blastocatellia bacterium]
MSETMKTGGDSTAWSEERWDAVERSTRDLALGAESERAAWDCITRQARAVMRAYSTSFFIVTRFLPPAKRARVEAIYSAVRYPDEIVDTFIVSEAERLRRLGDWAALYEEGVEARSIREALERGVPCFLSAFSRVVRDARIPVEHYRAFLDAMRRDVFPRPFASLDDLIESYVYGSAIVVGYFLAYVYGPSHAGAFDRALRSARNLAIALQLTNFARDVGEDQRRGRLYLPLDLLRGEGMDHVDVNDPSKHQALNRVLRRLSSTAESFYARSMSDIDAFASDSQVAIRACLDVYRQLNDRIGRSPRGILHRESVPISEKFKVLPASKYWRLPIA